MQNQLSEKNLPPDAFYQKATNAWHRALGIFAIGLIIVAFFSIHTYQISAGDRLPKTYVEPQPIATLLNESKLASVKERFARKAANFNMIQTTKVSVSDPSL